MRGVWPTLMFATMLFPAHRAHALSRDSLTTPSSRIWITGASNIRRFTCRARDVAGTIDLRARPGSGGTIGGDNLAAAPSLLVAISTIDCGIDAMNHHLREALRDQQ